MNIQTAFITGATGFIGTHLVRELVSRGAQAKCLVRRTSNVERLQGEAIELVEGDLARPDSYRGALQGCDVVLHLAGLTHAVHRDDLFRVNGEACGHLADACRSVASAPRLVYVSSLAAAGPPPSGKDVRDENDPPAPVSDYGRSKRLGEIELQRRAGEIPVTVIRPGVVIGPGDQKLVELIRPIYRFRVHLVVGFRTPRLSLIHVDDLVALILAAATRGETLEPHADGQYSPRGYYFASDDAEFPDYGQLGRRIARAMDRRVLVWPLWRWVGLSVAYTVETASRLRGRASVLNADKVREGIARSWACSSAKARQQLDFAPAQSLDERLRETVAWYIGSGWV